MVSKLVSVAMLSGVAAQKLGGMSPEEHLKMPIKSCTVAGGCVTEDTVVVLDSNWRWTHKTGCEPNCGTPDNCYTGNKWNTSICPDADTCSTSCSLDGVNEQSMQETYGIIADGQGLLNLSFVTNGPYSRNVGSRVYLMADDDKYKMFELLGKEFTFTVDTSHMPCGLNGALYFVEMEEDGGKSTYATNEVGAKYGTGYCDAQCPHDLKWINGEANMIGWNSSSSDPNAGVGKYGTCCAELDIWEANAISTQMTVHSCSTQGQHRCEGTECGDNASGERFKGVCDKNGCDNNPYRVGDHEFYGPGPQFKLNSLEPMTVVTSFPVDKDGNLVSMNRTYYQNGKKFTNAIPSYGAQYTAITDEYCDVQMTNFSDRLDVFQGKGGVKGMGEAMARKMVLTLSMWDDHEVGMIWLDAYDPYPVNKSAPWGAARGTCDQDSGNSTVVEAEHGDSYVIYSDIRIGEIGSTVPSTPTPPSPPTPPTPTPTPSTCADPFTQCGGQGWTGVTCCPTGYKCEPQNIYYSQCVSATKSMSQMWKDFIAYSSK